MRLITSLFLSLFCCCLAMANNSNEHPAFVTGCTGTQIAYWSLDACESFSSNNSNYDYSELTANTSTTSGISSVNASHLSNDDQHSCVYGQSGAGVCHDIRDNCTWVDNASDAFRFSVTINPENGSIANLTRLSFYERAPLNFSHLSGNSGDNDPPSRYGIRVLKNGQEIYQRVDRSTTHDWSLESFDFSDNANFQISATTTFEFELLGYCRSNGTSGLSVWDVDEIKVFGCGSTVDPCASQGGDSDGDGICNNQDCAPNNGNLPTNPGTACNDGNPNTTNDVIQGDGCSCAGTPTPCAGQGGDSDGDGICDNQDCAPNNGNLPTNPGTACNDGNPNTTNDVIQGDGCSCAGTPVGPTCSVTTDGCKITITGLGSGDNAKVFNSNWNVIWQCDPWGVGAVCSGTEMIDLPSNGTYYVQACGSTTAYTVTACATDPCAGQGGDSDGDGVCNNQDCQANNAAFPATPGTPCNDGNPNTTNDMVTSDGCGCAGTPVGPTCSVSTDGCKITITGLGSGDNAKVFDSNWNVIWQCDPWGVGAVCSGTEMIDLPSNGTYYVQACGSTTAYTVTGCATDPCAGQGGDSDGDGVCNNQDCQPNNAAFPATPGTPCNDGNPNTTNDMVTSDGCGCAGTPVGPTCSVSTDGCKITITGLGSGDNAKVFDSNWNVVWQCDPWGVGTVCSGTEMIDLPSNGTYYVQACGSTTAYTVTGCATDPCAGQGGDSDGDGVCNNQDCQPNNAAFPATPGTPCNDGNPNTTNDMVTSDGCGCAGTPVGPSCEVTTSACKITITGLSAGDNAKVFDANWNVVWQCDPWGVGAVCSGMEMIDLSSNGTYYVQACGQTNPYTVSGCAVDPCAGQGGDADGDGVCANQDCNDFNANLPAAPGTACNDGNPNTTNDVILGDGCSCAGTPVVDECSTITLVKYDMDACRSFTSDNSHRDFSEFTPDYPGSCNLNVQATAISNDVNRHSCVPGANGSTAGICVGGESGSNWRDDDNNAIKFSVTLTPSSNGYGSLTNLSFHQFSPQYYEHISGNTGTNNYLRKFGFRILRNGQEIYQVDDLNTSQNGWEYESFNLSGTQFDVTTTTTFTVEILGYRPNGSGSNMFFDIDHIRLKGECCTSQYRMSLESPEDFALYPNPAENFVNIELENYKDRDVTIQLVDQVGRTMKQMQIDQLANPTLRMDLEGINNGTYFIFVRTKEGHRFAKKLMIIKPY